MPSTATENKMEWFHLNDIWECPKNINQVLVSVLLCSYKCIYEGIYIYKRKPEDITTKSNNKKAELMSITNYKDRLSITEAGNNMVNMTSVGNTSQNAQAES